jgi:hypothetical protein
MAWKTGIGHSLSYTEETSWGTQASGADHYLDPRGGMETLIGTVEVIKPESLTSRGYDSSQFTEGNHHVSGNITHDLRFGGGWLLFASQLAGRTVTTAGVSAPYTHTLRLGGAVDTVVPARGITVVVDREGERAVAASKAVVFTGIRPTSVAFDFQQNAIATASWEVVGKDSTLVTRPTATLPTADYIKSPSAASSPTAVVKFGTDGSETEYTTVTSVQLNVEQPLASRFHVGSAAQAHPVQEGYTTITGSFDIEHQDTGSSSFGAFGDAYRAQTINSLIITFDGGTDDQLEFDMAKVLITSTADQHIDGSGLQTTTIEFEAAYATNSVCTLKLTNAEAVAHVAG